jgi:LysR family transcriptional regulator for bpeEF and oprC
VHIELIQIFVQVVKSGGFSKAAQALKIPKSTVSKAITKLEKDSGTKLLLRTTRTQTLTAEGRGFYDACVGAIESIENAHKSLYGNENLLTGTIKLTAPEDLGTEVIAPAAGVLSQKYPGLHFQLIYTNEVLDLVKDGYDLAVRIGKLSESSLKVKRIGEVKLILVASPSYLKKSGKISKPEDLKTHDCLTMSLQSEWTQWHLKSSSGSSAQVSVRSRVASNQMSSLLRAAVAGSGVALAPAFLAQPFLKSEKLIRVLPQWSTSGLTVSLLSPLPFSSSARLRLTADYLVGEMQKALENANA